MRITPITAYSRPIRFESNRQNLPFRGEKETETKSEGVLGFIAQTLKTGMRDKKEGAMQVLIRSFAKENSAAADEIKTKGAKVLKKAEEYGETVDLTAKQSAEIADIYEAKAKCFIKEWQKQVAAEENNPDLTEEEKEKLKDKDRTISLEPNVAAFFEGDKPKKIAEKLPNRHYNLINFDENGKIKSFYKDATRQADSGFEAQEGYIFENGKLKTFYKQVIKTFSNGHNAKESIEFDQDNQIVLSKNIIREQTVPKPAKSLYTKTEHP